MTLALYLWKEWRDHRAVVIGFALAVPVLLALLATVLPDDQLADPLFAWACALGGVAIAVPAIVSDLVPGEERRGHLGFLRRLPRDLGGAFLAKAAFLIAVVACFGLYGYFAGACAGALFAGGDWLPALDPELASTWPMAPVFVAWAFAVSCWLPRGTLALPATVLVLGLYLVPVLMINLAVTGLGEAKGELYALCALLATGAFPVAWWSFARGRRFGRGVLAAAWRGLLATLLLFTPAWGHVAHEAYLWTHFDPRHDRTRFLSAQLGEGGRYVFVNAALVRFGFEDRPNPPMSPVTALRVDLETGAWEQVGRAGDAFLPPVTWSLSWAARPVPRVALVDAAQERSKLRPDQSWLHWFDGHTGELVSSGWSDTNRPAGLAPDGWVARGCLGLGFQVFRDGRSAVYDPFRHRIYPMHLSVRVRPGRWLVQARELCGWLLLDPDSGETTAARGLHGLRPDFLLDDGRVLGCRDGSVVAVDPESGAVTRVAARADHVWAEARFPDGAHLISLQAGLRFRFAHLDPGTLRIEPVAALPDVAMGGVKVVAVTGARTLVVIRENRTIERVTLGESETEVLFPGD